MLFREPQAAGRRSPQGRFHPAPDPGRFRLRNRGDVGLLKNGVESLRQMSQGVEKMLNDRVFGERDLVLLKEKEEEIRAGLTGVQDAKSAVPTREIEQIGSDVGHRPGGPRCERQCQATRTAMHNQLRRRAAGQARPPRHRHRAGGPHHH